MDIFELFKYENLFQKLILSILGTFKMEYCSIIMLPSKVHCFGQNIKQHQTILYTLCIYNIAYNSENY